MATRISIQKAKMPPLIHTTTSNIPEAANVFVAKPGIPMKCTITFYAQEYGLINIHHPTMFMYHTEECHESTTY